MTKPYRLDRSERIVEKIFFIFFRIVQNELPRVLRECREMIGDTEDAILQQVIKKLLVPSEKDRASSVSDLIITNEQLSLLFETFKKERTIFIETLNPQITKY